jgi:hypothetical protein
MKVSTYQGMHPSARPVRHSSSNVDHCNSYRPRCEADLTTLTGLALCAGLLTPHPNRPQVSIPSLPLSSG